MKMAQHTALHHIPMQNTTQEAHVFGGSAYSYPPLNNLHMNTVSTMW